MDTAPRDVVRFWRAVEMFTPNALLPVDPDACVQQIGPGQLVPWEPGHRLLAVPLATGLRWRHTVYAGVYPIAAVTALLEQAFGQDDDPTGESGSGRSGDSALFSLTITAEGHLVPDSVTLASCAWAVGQTVTPGPAGRWWLEGFEEADAALADKITERFAPRLDDQAQPMRVRATGAALIALVEEIADWLHVGTALSPAGVRVHSVAVRDGDPDDSVDTLNSFFAADLASIAATTPGASLATYLTEAIDARRRVDVRAKASRVLEGVRPGQMPAGRWPTAPAQPLALSQQFAINEIHNDRQPIFAVNGPPGTGKTTMLRDLIAAIIVDRARQLAGLPAPGAGLGRDHRWTSHDGYTRIVAELDPSLAGYEMVVASSNNSAVENITDAIPARSAIDAHWTGADYFGDLASKTLGRPAWGLVAARLGNWANCRSFEKCLWWPTRADPGSNETEVPGLDQILKNLQDEPVDWDSARRRFAEAIAEVNKLTDARAAISDAVAALPAGTAAVTAAAAEVAAAQGETSRRGADARSASAARLLAQERADQASAERLTHRQFRPGFVEALFTLGRAVRRWSSADTPLAAADQAARATLQDACTAVEAAQNALRAAHVAQQNAEQQLADATAQRDRLTTTIARAEQNWPGQLPHGDRWEVEYQRELTAPWQDHPYNAARTRVFLAALDLHAAFITANAQRVRSGIRAAMDVVTGRAPGQAGAEAVLAAWRMLFLLIPVVSTTFASVARLLGPLDRDTLGWLFIDEAGQAAPQQAVGAIHRARRVVVVGDPLQLEPVVTIPVATQHALRRHYRVSELWLPSAQSVQTLADRHTQLGTRLDTDEPTWVGAPLRVHRRCHEPMFSIVNRIAYSNMMIYATPLLPLTTAEGVPVELPDSVWIDVLPDQAAGHWIPAEGRQLDRVLAGLARRGLHGSQIYALSPFRTVATQLQRRQDRYPGLTAGTIHKGQGREADVVILVLGGDPARPGAKNWAAQRPNLLNVAISRARHRLYVIGHRDAWKTQPYFDDLANSLPPSPATDQALGRVQRRQDDRYA